MPYDPISGTEYNSDRQFQELRAELRQLRAELAESNEQAERWKRIAHNQSDQSDRFSLALAEVQADFGALQNALVGDSGLSAILSAARFRADSALLDRVRNYSMIAIEQYRFDRNRLVLEFDSPDPMRALVERLTK